jgi:hypothetical protein
MDLVEFVIKYNGKKVDFDNYAGPQCVDLPRQYWKDVCGIQEHTGVCATSGGAKDLYLDYMKMPLERKYFNRYSASLKAKSGDVAIWDSNPNNKYGHVAIVIGEIDNYLIVFEQNGFTQDGAKINLRSKDYLLGVLRRK